MGAITISEAREAGARKTYREQIRAAILAYWLDEITIDDFIASMLASIRAGLTSAWERGADKAGAAWDELSAEEIAALETAIQNEFGFVAGLASDIASRREKGDSLGFADNRAQLWAARFDEVESQAVTMAGKQQRLQWRMGFRREHCPDCRRLHLVVKRASTWEKARERGLYPQSRELKCRGYRCGCRLWPTTLPASPGPLPNIGFL